jgi:hypothetical protein
MEKTDLILDVCCGLKGWSNVWIREGYTVETLDIDKRFKPTYCMDVRDFKPIKKYKVIFCSPPCTYFTFARCAITTDEERKEGLEIARKCFRIAENYSEYYIIENPYWKHSLQSYIKKKNHHIIDYCMYGYGYKKPTSIWTNIEGLEFRRCIHKFNSHPSSKMMYSSKQRAKIPVSLAQHLFDVLNNSIK